MLIAMRRYENSNFNERYKHDLLSYVALVVS